MTDGNEWAPRHAHTSTETRNLTVRPITVSQSARDAVARHEESKLVTIVRYTSECDVAEIPGIDPMSYEQAVAELAEVNRVAPKRLREFDIVTVQPDGSLGRFVSWSVGTTYAVELKRQFSGDGHFERAF